MRFTKRFLTLIFAIILLIGSTALTTLAQRRGGGRHHRPVIVRVWPSPFGYWNYWGDPYFYDPYLNERRQRYYLEQELRGDQRELSKHLKKYNADGVITAKEQEELNDDYRDIEKAQQRLDEFNRGE